jgi:hypothetical protein
MRVATRVTHAALELIWDHGTRHAADVLERGTWLAATVCMRVASANARFARAEHGSKTVKGK